jgi:hypothetical protein
MKCVALLVGVAQLVASLTILEEEEEDRRKLQDYPILPSPVPSPGAGPDDIFYQIPVTPSPAPLSPCEQAACSLCLVGGTCYSADPVTGAPATQALCLRADVDGEWCGADQPTWEALPDIPTAPTVDCTDPTAVECVRRCTPCIGQGRRMDDGFEGRALQASPSPGPGDPYTPYLPIVPSPEPYVPVCGSGFFDTDGACCDTCEICLPWDTCALPAAPSGTLNAGIRQSSTSTNAAGETVRTTTVGFLTAESVGTLTTITGSGSSTTIDSSATEQVSYSYTMSGDPSDYDSYERLNLLEANARAIGFPTAPPGSSIEITSGSVIVSNTFPADATQAAEVIAAAAAITADPTTLQTAIAAQLTALGATVTTSAGTGFTVETINAPVAQAALPANFGSRSGMRPGFTATSNTASSLSGNYDCSAGATCALCPCPSGCLVPDDGTAFGMRCENLDPVGAIVTAAVCASAPGSTFCGATEEEESNPCFPSTAVVTKADGTTARIEALKQGDAIKVIDREGALTTDTVSGLSVALPEAQATFLTLTTAAGANLTLTPEHHVPVGAACCATTKQAKDIAVGETVYQVKAGAAVATTVTKIAKAAKQGLHSPVTTRGTYPIVDGFATAFDSARKMHLASYAVPLLEATGTSALFRRAFLASGNKYVKA